MGVIWRGAIIAADPLIEYGPCHRTAGTRQAHRGRGNMSKFLSPLKLSSVGSIFCRTQRPFWSTLAKDGQCSRLAGQIGRWRRRALE
jgi:hypothetical protein